MKELADGTKINSGSYYFLLDYNDRNNFEYLLKTFNNKKLCELNLDEYIDLYKHASDEEVLYQFLKMNHEGVPQSKEHLNFISDILMKI